MKKPNIANFAKQAWVSVSKHSPEILTGIGIAGMITTTVLAVKATPKAIELLEDATYEKRGEKLKPVEKVKAAWKPYIPAAVTGVASITCLISASSVSAKRTAALAAAYQISETALTDYREKVVETVGEKKEQAIREKVNQKQIDETPIQEENIINTRKGNTLFLDPLTKRVFRSDLEKVRKAANDLNEEIIHHIGGSVSLNEFYGELGLDYIDLGNELGWNTEYLIKLDLTPGATRDNEPCWVVGHYNPPRYGY